MSATAIEYQIEDALRVRRDEHYAD